MPNKEDLKTAFLTLIALLFIWFGLIKSRDMIHLIPTMPVAYVFFAYFLNKAYDKYFSAISKYKSLQFYYFIFPVMFFCLFGLYINIENETFRFSSEKIWEMKYNLNLDKGKHLVVESSKGQNIEQLVQYLNSNTNPDEKIFLFYIDSSIYVFAERMPATFNTIFIPDAFRPRYQKNVRG